MSEESDSPKDRVERLLRQWGTVEAVREATARATQAPLRRTAGHLAVLRWVPVAAAALLLVAAVGVFVASRVRQAPEPVLALREATPPQEIKELHTELAHVQDELRRSQSALTKAKRELAVQADRLKAALAHFEEEKADLIARAEQERTELRQSVTEKESQLNAALAELKDARSRTETTSQQLASSREELVEARKQFAAQTEHLRAMHSQAVAARREVEIQLTSLRDQQAEMMTNFRALLLAVASSSQSRLHALRAPATHSRLIQRCAALRGAAHSETTRQLLDKLEVVLTRLDLLDAQDADAVASFARSVRRAGLLQQIEDVLAATEEGPEVQTWLFEAQLILIGAARVG